MMFVPLNQEKMRKLHTEISSHFPFIVNLSHQKGGVGKSTLAYNIADAFRILGFNVKLFDMDIQNSCGELNGLRETPFEDIKKVSGATELVGLINDAASDGSEIIIIDTGGFDAALSRLAIMGSDMNLTPISDKVTEILAVVQKYNQTLSEIAYHTEKSVSSYLLLNRIHPFAKDFEHIEEMIEESPHMRMFKTIIRDRAIYDKSLIDGRTVFEATELKGHQEATQELLLVSQELLATHIKIKDQQ